jgi:hypothetical protein
MTKIDFYQIESDEAPLLFSCRLVAKIYRMGHQVHIHTENEAQAKEMDALLWHFRPESFIPHTLDNLDEEAPIRIGCSKMSEPNTIKKCWSIYPAPCQIFLVGSSALLKLYPSTPTAGMPRGKTTSFIKIADTK